MNREEVIRMATEAGLLEPGYIHGNTVIAELERFAALVAAAERRKHQADIEHWKAQAAQAEKWCGMAHARHCDSKKVVQEIQREAMERERENIAAEFDRRAAPSTGFYEPHEPAEIIRARGNQ